MLKEVYLSIAALYIACFFTTKKLSWDAKTTRKTYIRNQRRMYPHY
jgi:hypothetical protein